MFLPSSRFLALVGLVLSLYAVYVEHKVEYKDPDEEFSALCDIEAIGASCRYVLVVDVMLVGTLPPHVIRRVTHNIS